MSSQVVCEILNAVGVDKSVWLITATDRNGDRLWLIIYLYHYIYPLSSRRSSRQIDVPRSIVILITQLHLLTISRWVLIGQQICPRCVFLLLIFQLHLLKAVTLITAELCTSAWHSKICVMTSYFVCYSVVAVLRHPGGYISAWSVALKWNVSK